MKYKMPKSFYEALKAVRDAMNRKDETEKVEEKKEKPKEKPSVIADE